MKIKIKIKAKSPSHSRPPLSLQQARRQFREALAARGYVIRTPEELREVACLYDPSLRALLYCEYSPEVLSKLALRVSESVPNGAYKYLRA